MPHALYTRLKIYDIKILHHQQSQTYWTSSGNPLLDNSYLTTYKKEEKTPPEDHKNKKAELISVNHFYVAVRPLCKPDRTNLP